MAKRIFALMLCAVAMLSLIPGSACAAEFIDTSAEPTLTVVAQKNETLLVGARFDLYLVARIDEYGEITVTEDFARFDLEIRGENEGAWNEMLLTLEGYILVSGLQPTDSGVTGEDGKLQFPTGETALEQGLYLVTGYSHTQGGKIYTPGSFLVMLPARDKITGEWAYDVTASPKFGEPEAEPIKLKVLKVWNDKGYESLRPSNVVIQLYKNGIVVDTVTLSENNYWRHTWENLEPPFSQYKVVEVPSKTLSDYTVKVTLNGITYTVTNSINKTPPPTTPGGGKLPQTGQLWWPVPVLFAIGLALVVLGMARRRGNGYEE